MDQSESQRDFLDMDTAMDPGKEIQNFKDTQPCHPPLGPSLQWVSGVLTRFIQLFLKALRKAIKNKVPDEVCPEHDREYDVVFYKPTGK